MTSELVKGLFVNRHSAITAFAATGAGLLTVGKPPQAAVGKPLDFDSPRDNLYAFGKIWGGYDEPVLSAFHGLMYAGIGAKRLMPLFGYTGTGVMQSKIDSDGNCWIRGKETGYFTDLASGDILDTWKNPFTGETVKVFNFYNPTMRGTLTAEMPRFAMGATKDDATLMNAGTQKNAAGKVPFIQPFHVYGDVLMLAWDYAHEYTNPVNVEGWPKACTGPRSSPSEHFTFSMSLSQMQDRSVPSSRFIAGFSRLSQWWPCMPRGIWEAYAAEVPPENPDYKPAG